MSFLVEVVTLQRNSGVAVAVKASGNLHCIISVTGLHVLTPGNLWKLSHCFQLLVVTDFA